MTGNIEAFKSWTPYNVFWTQWTKPIMFASMPLYGSFTMPNLPAIPWLPKYRADAAIIVDLPGIAGLLEGLAVAELGYFPISLYNAARPTDFGINVIVPVEELQYALLDAAPTVGRFINHKNPVFLLDSNRYLPKNRNIVHFDNRWRVFPQDMPSASCLKKHHINKVILRSDIVQYDLSHILLRYEEQGIAIYKDSQVQNSDEHTIALFHPKKPSSFKKFFYRFMEMASLSQNSAGAFGATYSPNTGGGHYG